jgi:hypothetical protein
MSGLFFKMIGHDRRGADLGRPSFLWGPPGNRVVLGTAAHRYEGPKRRLRGEPVVKAGRWTRDELYDDASVGCRLASFQNPQH